MRPCVPCSRPGKRQVEKGGRGEQGVVVVGGGRGDGEMVVGIHLLRRGRLVLVSVLVLLVLVLAHVDGKTRVGDGGGAVAGDGDDGGRVVG